MARRFGPRTAVAVLSWASWLLGSVSGASVNVALDASFATPPFLLELLETVAQENASAYFPLLDRIADGRFADYTTDRELYDVFVKTLRKDELLASPSALATFELAMSVHASAPRIEAHYQYYRDSVEPLLPAAQDAVCPVWAHYNGKQYCSPTLERAQQDFDADNDRELPFDRILSLSPELPIATLYLDINTPALAQFHQELTAMAQSGRLSYRIRYRPSAAPSPPLPMSGYGVELQLKRTDYIVIDDRAEGAAEPAEDPHAEFNELDDLKPLSSSQLSKLGIKTGSFVMGSGDPFDTLERVSQDFPKFSLPIANTNATDDFIAEHKQNRRLFLNAGYNVVWMNGLQVDFRSMNAFALLDRLRRERKLVESMQAVGLSAPQAIALLSHRAVTEAKSSDDAVRYDYRDTHEGGRSIIWLNNIEKDKRYDKWSSEASMLLQPQYPGQLPTVRRDIHNVIVPVDLGAPADLEEVVQTLQMLVRRLVPVQFGFVPSSTGPESALRAKVAYYLQEKYGLGVLLQYLTYLLAEDKNTPTTPAKIDFFVQSRHLRKGQEALAIADVLEGPEYQGRIDATKRYLRRLGAAGEDPPAFVNGAVVPRNDAWLQSMSTRISMDTQIIQGKMFEDPILDDAWIAGHFVEGAPTSRNPLIMPDDEDSELVVDLGALLAQHPEAERLPTIKAEDTAAKQSWSHNVIVVDLESPAGVHLLTSAIEWRKAQPEAELVILHNGAPDAQSNPVSAALFEVLSTDTQLTAASLDRILQAAVAKDETGMSEMAATFWERMQPLVFSLGLQPGENAILMNGRIVGPITEEDVFDADAFTQLLTYEQKKRITPVTTALVDLKLDDRLDSPFALARMTTMIALSGQSGEPEGIFGNTPTIRMNHFADWQDDHTAIKSGDPNSALIQIVASIEPTSEVAQRWIPILRVLSKLDGVALKLFLNPRDVITELPVKRFYRHVLKAKLQFDDEGGVRAPRASFEGLPKKALLNFGMDLPPAWQVSPKESIHDLDNIRLSSLKAGQNVDAVYELEHILIEGHSRDITTGSQPRGAQLWLGTEKDEHFADTLIMSNLGYFQFKANPGHWNIQLKPGRSREVFRIDNIGLDGYSKHVHQGQLDATLMSFQGLTLYPTISRNPGHEEDDVLQDSGAGGSYAAKASNLASGFLANVGLGKKSKHADINIFSVASGHLYERMLNIMMVSVMKHTKHTVKFWFIEQFLSPSFKKTLPAIAKEYNFEYEMVTYKWPHWLRSQSEKQREIWGYKILFLDVLFPLSLDKVIFVDADQIVRADMYELVTHDLEGKPYGFTPMCDSRTEMEGFRFWKQGYWKNFLRGLPYHISALYVVDLKRFRQMAAGDRLRQQYHQLSADPNSLANLDQDLPNNMQMALPIHSLPQEWLWCETWCSDESLKDAKTIDLCNNPQTFEPKLDRARRQVPEWTVYDDEIAAVIKRSHGADDVAEPAENVQEELDQRGDKAAKDESSAAEHASPEQTTKASSREKDEL